MRPRLPNRRCRAEGDGNEQQGRDGMGPTRRTLGQALLALPAIARTARAETGQIRLGKQYGLPFLPQMVMEHERLIEKHANQPGLRVEWASLGGPGALNEALLSGSMEFVNVATPALATLWERTQGTPRVIKALCTVQSMPYELMTRNPKVHAITDFGPDDRIAVPTVNISLQAMMLQMAAAKQWGLADYKRLDPLTVSLGHPDALIAMLSGKSEITAHFCVAPFQYYEKAAGMRSIVKTYDVLGGPHTNGIQVTSEAFYKSNQALCEAVFAAHGDANDFIRRDPAGAAEIYRTLSGDKRSTPAELVVMITDPDIVYTQAPANMMKMVRFMADTGRMKTMPARWQDMFLPTAHALQGS
jgi:NitT/TauT family transport system substrate-binding protein